MILTNILTNLVNSCARITGWCTGTDEEHEIVRTTSSFVAVHDYCGRYDDDSSANATQCCESESAVRIKPMAGSTTVYLPHHTIQDTERLKKAVRQQDKMGWISTPSSMVNVRGENYTTDKKKVPSAMALYELVKLDAVQSNSIYLDIGEKYNLNQFMQKEDVRSQSARDGKEGSTSNGRRRNNGKPSPRKPPTIVIKSPQNDIESLDLEDKTWNSPTYLIISFLLPTSAPKLTQRTSEKGYIVTAYYRMRQETKEILRIVSNPKYMNDQKAQLRQIGLLSKKDLQKQRINAVRLWEKWCTQSPHDPEMQKRLKFLPNINNLEEIGVANWICKYKCTPMLIKRPGVTNFVFSHYQEERMEININMHPLPYVFKQVVSHLNENYFEDLIMTFAFTIESRDEDELPEVVLGDPFILPFVSKDKIVKAKNIF